MHYLLCVILIFTTCTLSAQYVDVRGVLVDEEGNSLPSATVMLMKNSDSTLINFIASDTHGAFLLKRVPVSEAFIKVTYMGFLAKNISLSSPEGDLLDLKNIVLQSKATQLEEVTIKGEHAPVTMKKDTIEYNARAFKTQQNATVEELLKELPGVEVDTDGEITAQGEKVQRVMVDGKEFFGRDPKMATRNLPADAVEKVQVIDGKSEQARFSGIDDGVREKQINLELKEDRKNGAFGTATAGVGTDNRFEGKTNINRFSKGSQLSMLGMANNTNQQGFSMGEYMNFTGAASQLMSGGGGRISITTNSNSGIPLAIGESGNSNGLMTIYAGGLNFNKDLTEDLEANGSYFFNHLGHDITQSLVRENFQPEPENNFNYFENSVQENMNTNHRANTTLDYDLDSANSFRFNGNASITNTNSNSIGSSQTVRQDGELQNESSQLSSTTGGSLNTNGNILYRHKFAKKGRTISVDSEINYQENDRKEILNAVNSFYGPSYSEITIDQEAQQNTLNRTLGSTLSYTEPLGGKKYLEAKYTIRQNRNDVNRNVYDVVGEQREFNTGLSNSYMSDYLYQRGGINVRFVKSKYNFTAGMAYQATQLVGRLKLQDIPIEQRFNRLLPSARLSYEFTNNQRINIEYETSIQEPTIQQLQPVVDNRNPLNIYEGNPNLQPEYRQNVRIQYNTFDPVKFLGFFSFVDITYTDNAIINTQSVNEQFVRYTRPENNGSALMMRANANLSFPLAVINSRFNIGATVSDRHSATVLDDVESDIRQSAVSLNLRYTFKYNEMFDLGLRSSFNKQLSKYELNQPDQAFINSIYTGEINYSFLKHYRLNSEYNYMLYNNENMGFKEDISMLNISLARTFLKDDKGELKLSVINALDENVGLSQNTGLNYIETQTTNSLGRYFMIGITYVLNKGLNPMGGGKGGVMIMRN